VALEFVTGKPKLGGMNAEGPNLWQIVPQVSHITTSSPLAKPIPRALIWQDAFTPASHVVEVSL
jgi:hypothetical protein